MQANSSEKEQARGKQKDAAQSQDKVVTTKQRNLRGVDERCPEPIIGGWFAFPCQYFELLIAAKGFRTMEACSGSLSNTDDFDVWRAKGTF